jgi:hypothetical protein
MTLSGVSDGNLLVFRMLFNFILPTMPLLPLSLLMLGHKSESIRGSNMWAYETEGLGVCREDFRHTARVCLGLLTGRQGFFLRQARVVVRCAKRCRRAESRDKRVKDKTSIVVVVVGLGVRVGRAVRAVSR